MNTDLKNLTDSVIDITENVIVSLDRISHLGIVVRNLERTENLLQNILGWRKISSSITPQGEKTYKGKAVDFSCKMSFYSVGKTEIELIEPVFGANVWKDFLDKRGEGLHHIQIRVENFEIAKRYLESKGLEMIQSGPSDRYKGCRWCYFDTLDLLGYYIEIINTLELGYTF